MKKTRRNEYTLSQVGRLADEYRRICEHLNRKSSEHIETLLTDIGVLAHDWGLTARHEEACINSIRAAFSEARKNTVEKLRKQADDLEKTFKQEVRR